MVWDGGKRQLKFLTGSPRKFPFNSCTCWVEKFVSLGVLRRLWLVIHHSRYFTFCYSPQQRHLGGKLSYCCADLGSSYCRGIGIVEGQIYKCVEVTCNGLKFIPSSVQIMLTHASGIWLLHQINLLLFS